MKKQRWSLLALLFALVLALAACSGNTTEKPADTEKPAESEETKTETPESTETASDSLFELAVTNDGQPINGGILKVAMVKDEPFAGVFSWELYDDGYDSDILNFATNALFATDGNFMVSDEGIASLSGGFMRPPSMVLWIRRAFERFLGSAPGQCVNTTYPTSRRRC